MFKSGDKEVNISTCTGKERANIQSKYTVGEKYK